MKHTVASLEVRIAALEASFAERSAQTKQFIAEFAALRAQSDALNARLAARSTAPATANAAPRAKHVVQISRRDDGQWQVWLDYKPHTAHAEAANARAEAKQLAMSFAQ